MNLEEELNILVNEKNIDEEKKVNKLFNNLSPEQWALVMSLSKGNKEEQKEVPKEKVNDYKDNYVLPKEEEQETNMNPFGSNIALDNKYNQTPTELSQLINIEYHPNILKSGKILPKAKAICGLNVNDEILL